MRKEIIGILLFFLVVFTLVSLLSYNPADPSINNAKTAGDIHNMFGMLGAQIAGILIGLFGLGAFWLPVLLLLVSIHFFGDSPRTVILMTTAGGILLLVTSGAILALKQNHYIIFDNKFSAGGIIGIPLKAFLVRYCNMTGGALILIILWMIGLIMSTGFSFIVFFRRCRHLAGIVGGSVGSAWSRYRERKKKAEKRSAALKKRKTHKERKIEIKASKPGPVPQAPVPKQAVFDFMRDGQGLQLPSFNLLDNPEVRAAAVDHDNLRMQSKLLEKKLEDFGVKGKVVTVSPGPVITTFEYEPAPGVKINKVVNLTDDLALALRATSIRIVAPIPGKAVIGIEIPNADREVVRFKEIVASPAFEKSKSRLTICLGKDIVGSPVVAELEKMPHLLIAGATGAGKSVALNTMICSLLYKASPADVKFIMIDPKRIELSSYDGIPHLITPVVTDVKKATNALFWAVNEMEKRYELLAREKTKNIHGYNQKIEKLKKSDEKADVEKLPFIVIIIDELADLMMVASRDVEIALTRLAQMARAAGIHLILATQRPSVDVLTGIIKANFPTRLTFQVSSKTDSRTIIDANGAENLLGNGDMLFLPPGTAKLQRIHGAYISESELARIIDFLKTQQKPEYNQDVTKAPVKEPSETGEQEYDEKYDEAVALVSKTRQASISMVQRYLRIGYNRAARIIEMMEKEGVVGPADGARPREVLIREYGED